MPILLWLLILLSIAAWATAFWAVTHPNILGRGQDAAGRGMAVGCAFIIFGGFGTLCSIAAATLAFLHHATLDPITHSASFIPLALIAAGFLSAWALAKKSRAARQRDARKQERQTQSIIILCDADPQLTCIFEALHAAQPTRWTQLFQNPEALRWQFPNYAYRAALICIYIDTSISKDPELDTILEMAARESPPSPAGTFLLYGPDDSLLTPLAARLKKSRWPAETLTIPSPLTPATIQSILLPRLLPLAGPAPSS